VLVAALTAGQLPLVAAPASVPLATGLAALAGLALAPSLACAFVVIDRHAPRGTVTEAFSWLVTTFGVGAAVGTAAAGPAVERGEGAAGFAGAAACAVLALLTLLATGRALALPEGVPVRAAGGRNDRNAASEPGFRTGHQA
jgi:predicted MFS family arabinose efflux permease